MDAHQRRDPGLLHGHAVYGVGGFRGGARVVRDDDELRIRLEFVQHLHEAADVRVVERRVDLVEQTERARLRQENSEQKREGYERSLAAG